MKGKRLNSSIAQKRGQLQSILRNRLARRRYVLLALPLALLFVTGCATAAAQGLVPAAPQLPAGVQVTFSAPATTISYDDRDPARERFELPLLYLHRQREPTAPAERTLLISLTGIGAGSEVVVEATSQHENVATGGWHSERMHFLSDRDCTGYAPCSVQMVLDPNTMPSDLYFLRVTDAAGQVRWEMSNRPAFAALDTWDVGVSGAIVRVYYAQLFPFARGEADRPNRLPPDAVPDFIEKQMAPIVQETWRTQVEEWGFGPLHPDWDADHIVEVIITDPPFALFDGTGTYTLFHGDDGRFYSTRRIWWFACNNSFAAYDTLEDAYKATFPHEFFHLMQWNVLLQTGQPYNYWQGWLEGQGVVAPTIQYPELRHNTYAIVADRVRAQGLGPSWAGQESDPGNCYDSAPFWRFIYEQYGGPQIFRAALEEMVRTAGQDTDNVAAAMKRALDAAFARVDGRFGSFEEGFLAYASAE